MQHLCKTWSCGRKGFDQRVPDNGVRRSFRVLFFHAGQVSINKFVNNPFIENLTSLDCFKDFFPLSFQTNPSFKALTVKP